MASFVIGGDTSGQITIQAPSVAGTRTITWPAETGTVMTTATVGNAAAGQIRWNLTPQTGNFTAVTWGGYFVNTTSGAVTVTLPSSPSRGNFVVIVDYAGTAATNNITVSGNGANINGTTTSRALQTNRQGITFTYIDSTQGWLASSNVYGGNPPFVVPPYSVSYLAIAGGGGGNYVENSGGGGGAGGLLSGTASLTSGAVYTVTVGSGGSGGTGSTGGGGAGTNSVLSGSGITTQTAVGGGGGSTSGARAAAGGNGGSGGGGGGWDGGSYGAGGTGTPGQGNNGASGSAQSFGGGGGGAGAAASVKNGGAGTASSITGTPATYAGGGGGGGDGRFGSGGSGGSGGGGNALIAGTANTGGGGGGGGYITGNGAAGGSGVVILSIPTANYTGTTTGSPTITTSGSNTIVKYTASGTYTA